MRRTSMGFIGLCLLLMVGLTFVNVGLCQQAKPGETTEQAAPSGVKEKKAAKEKAPAPEKAAKQPKAESKPATPERSASPGKLPGKFAPSEGC
jgi:hypothetical protein